MTAPITISAVEIEAALDGRGDGLKTRLIALLVLKGALDMRMALRRFDVGRSTLYAAKIDLEDAINRKAEFAKKANEIRLLATTPKIIQDSHCVAEPS